MHFPNFSIPNDVMLQWRAPLRHNSKVNIHERTSFWLLRILLMKNALVEGIQTLWGLFGKSHVLWVGVKVLHAEMACKVRQRMRCVSCISFFANFKVGDWQDTLGSEVVIDWVAGWYRILWPNNAFKSCLDNYRWDVWAIFCYAVAEGAQFKILSQHRGEFWTIPERHLHTVMWK